MATAARVRPIHSSTAHPFRRHLAGDELTRCGKLDIRDREWHWRQVPEPWVCRNEIFPLSVGTRVLASDVEPLRVASVERFDHATVGPDQVYSAMPISTTAQLFTVLLSVV